jgi:transcriptional regulator with XRE-family HTH domain
MEELRRMREQLGWTQQRLANESGVDRATISQVEGGRRSPSIATLESLAEAMGTEVADFFPKVQAPLFMHEQVAEPRRPEAIINELREWRQTAAHVQEWARVDRTELLDTEELPRGWQRGVFGARAVHDNVGRLSTEAEEAFGLDKDMPRELSEAVEEAKSAANATLAEALQFFDTAEEVADRAGVREGADVHDLRELIESWAA